MPELLEGLVMNYKLFKFKMKVMLLKYKKKFLSAFEYQEEVCGEKVEAFSYENRDGKWVQVKLPRSFKNMVLNIRDYFFMIKVKKLSITEYGMFTYTEKEIAFKNIFTKFGNWFFRNLLPNTYFSWSIKRSLKNAIKQMERKGEK